jgi:hypothetical protein
MKMPQEYKDKMSEIVKQWWADKKKENNYEEFCKIRNVRARATLASK